MSRVNTKYFKDESSQRRVKKCPNEFCKSTQLQISQDESTNALTQNHDLKCSDNEDDHFVFMKPTLTPW